MTRDVSDLYDRSRPGATFGLDTGFGGDRIALSSGRVDPARMELHEAAEREMHRAGDGDYSGALDRVLAGARHGTVMLSQAALQSAGVVTTGTRPGRGGVRHDPVSGRVVTLAGAVATEEDLGAPAVLHDDADRRRWEDTLHSCQARKADASYDQQVASSRALVARSGAGRWVGD